MDDEAKLKHSKRLLQKHNFLEKQKRLAKNYGIDLKDDQVHRYQKMNLLNCGDPKCIMCSNPRKIFKEKTIKEKSFEQTRSWDE